MIALTHLAFKIEKSKERSRLRCWDLPDGERILLSPRKLHPTNQALEGLRRPSARVCSARLLYDLSLNLLQDLDRLIGVFGTVQSDVDNDP